MASTPIVRSLIMRRTKLTLNLDGIANVFTSRNMAMAPAAPPDDGIPELRPILDRPPRKPIVG